MLMLTRKPGEDLVLYTDDGLKVTIGIDWIRGNQVRIGIDAPKTVHIDRKELYLRKQAEKAQV